jgi:hypothetical protein
MKFYLHHIKPTPTALSDKNLRRSGFRSRLAIVSTPGDTSNSGNVTRDVLVSQQTNACSWLCAAQFSEPQTDNARNPRSDSWY